MTVVIDTNVLIYFLNEKTLPPMDPSTGAPLTYCIERVALLIDTLQKARETIIVPTPVLAEVLVRAEAAGPSYLALLDKTRHIRVADFDKRAALETSLMIADIYRTGGKPSGGDARAKLKFDTMIAAVARVAAAKTVYSDDSGMKALGAKFGFTVIGVLDLPLPPQPEADLLSPLEPGR